MKLLLDFNHINQIFNIFMYIYKSSHIAVKFTYRTIFVTSQEKILNEPDLAYGTVSQLQTNLSMFKDTMPVLLKYES